MNIPRPRSCAQSRVDHPEVVGLATQTMSIQALVAHEVQLAELRRRAVLYSRLSEPILLWPVIAALVQVIL